MKKSKLLSVPTTLFVLLAGSPLSASEYFKEPKGSKFWMGVAIGAAGAACGNYDEGNLSEEGFLRTLEELKKVKEITPSMIEEATDIIKKGKPKCQNLPHKKGLKH